MFTGIIETTGLVREIEKNGDNVSYWIESPLSQSLKIDQSVSHNGVCLTVEAINNSLHKVTAISETLKKSNLGQLEIGSLLNLERSMLMNGRLDGHIVQGHVDTTANCIAVNARSGSWEFNFEIDEKFGSLIIEKGSITIDGISLTIFNITANSFTVAIIPYTFNYTNIHQVKKGKSVNIEFDILGKYVARIAALKNT